MCTANSSLREMDFFLWIQIAHMKIKSLTSRLNLSGKFICVDRMLIQICMGTVRYKANIVFHGFGTKFWKYLLSQS